MRIQIRLALVLLFAEALLAATSLHPQTAMSADGANAARPEIDANFASMGSNSPVSGCGCFGRYEGSATSALPVAHGPIAVAGGRNSRAIDSRLKHTGTKR